MKKHTDALVALIQAVPALASATFVSRAVTADGSPVPLPYVVIHPTDGRDDSDRLAAPGITQNPRFQITSVGSTYEQCAWAAEKVKAVLVTGGIGVAPTISGERAGSFWYSVPQAVQTDNEVNPPLLYHTAECGFSSVPTA